MILKIQTAFPQTDFKSAGGSFKASICFFLVRLRISVFYVLRVCGVFYLTHGFNLLFFTFLLISFGDMGSFLVP